MKKKWMYRMGLAVLFLVFGLLLYNTSLKIENHWANKDDKPIVLANKTWKIMFSEKINESTINEKRVYVENENGEKQDVTFTLSKDKKTLVISPPDKGYDLKSQYFTLHIKKGIKSTLGRSLWSGKKMTFIVKEDLPVVSSKSELNNYFLQILDEQKEERKWYEKLGMSKGVREESAESADTAVVEKQSEQDVSETNVQVKGIDESDIVKTNGTHIFQVVDGKVNIIKAIPSTDMVKVSTISFMNESINPNQLFLQNDQLVVIGHSYASQEKKIMDSIAPMYEATKAIVYNIQNPKSPTKVKEVLLEGSLVNARKIQDKVYLVTNYQPNYWILEENERMDLRPRISDSAKESIEIEPVEYKKIQYFPDSKETNYTTIAAFSLKDLDKEMTVSTLLGGGHQMYMSDKNIYLAVENYSKSMMNSEQFVAPDSIIYKFSVNGLNVSFFNSVEVPGTVLNQFSMDEHKGYFRVATTKGYAWDENRPSANHLTIFDEHLKQVGQLEGLARGERIYSARFMGDRIYIVTFKETDPLFVIDASNPSTPKVLGELKIPGFSNYLHPLDDNHIIGFGYDTKLVTDKGSNQPRVLTEGVKLSLFDISDVNNPKEKFTEIIGGRGTHSPLNHDHKALLYNPKTNLFAFPINVYHAVEGSEYEQTFKFQGAYVYKVTAKNGFKLNTKISHHDEKSIYESWESQIQRLLYIDDSLYTLSNSKITAHSLKDYRLLSELYLNK